MNSDFYYRVAPGEHVWFLTAPSSALNCAQASGVLVEPGGEAMRLTTEALAVLIELSPDEDGHVDRDVDTGAFRLWLGGCPYEITGVPLTTTEATRLAAAVGQPMRVNAFRGWAARLRARGYEVRAPEGTWPDRRSPRYDAARVREALLDPAIRPRAARRATPHGGLPPATCYGSWAGDIAPGRTVWATVQAAMGDDADDARLVGIAVDTYVEAINEALPEGFVLRNDCFYGPFPRSPVDLTAAVSSVDLAAIAAKARG